MNTIHMISAGRIVAAVAAVALLAGCASGGSSLTTKSRGYSGSDADYVYAVERAARSKGVKIVWVNPPPEQGKTYVRSVE